MYFFRRFVNSSQFINGNRINRISDSEQQVLKKQAFCVRICTEEMYSNLDSLSLLISGQRRR